MLIRNKEFPFFKNNKDIIFLDSAATTQKPKIFFESIRNGYIKYNFPAGKSHYNIAEESFEILNETKKIISELLSINKQNVFFTPSSTLTSRMLYDIFLETMKKSNNNKNKIIKILAPYDIHNSFIDIWKKSENSETIKLFWYELQDFYKYINENEFDLILITLKSNLTGTIFDLNNLNVFLNFKKKPLIFIDASQYFPIKTLNVNLSLIDGIFFSSHKMYGPYGISPLILSEKILNIINIDSLKNFIKNFGSIPIPNFYSFNSILKWINKNIYSNGSINLKFNNFFYKINNFLIDKKGIIISDEKTNNNIISFYFKNVNSYDLADILSKKNILIRAGNMCNNEYMNFLKLPPVLRISFGIYTEESDILKLIYELNQLNLGL